MFLKKILCALMFVVYLLIFSKIQAFSSGEIKNLTNDYLDHETTLLLINSFNAKDASISNILNKLDKNRNFTDAHVFLKNGILALITEEKPIVRKLAAKINGISVRDLENFTYDFYPGSIYTTKKIGLIIQHIQDLYRSRGHPFIGIKSKVIRCNRGLVDIFFIIESGNLPILHEIRFTGNKILDHSKLETILKIRKKSTTNYKPNKVLNSQEVLQRLYFENGYSDFHVESSVVELESDQESLVLTFFLHEGSRYHISKVEVISQTPKIDSKHLDRYISHVRGKSFRSSLVNELTRILIKVLDDLDHTSLEVHPFLRKNEVTKELEISFLIQDKKRIQADHVSIIGNERTDEFILRESLHLYEGDFLDSVKLKNLEWITRKFGVLKDIKIVYSPSRVPMRKEIEVKVEEGKTGELQFGAGFSHNDGILANIHLAEHNLSGRGRDLHISVTQAERRQEFDISFTEPSFMGKNLTAKVDVYRLTSCKPQSQALCEDQHGMGINLAYKLSDTLLQSIGYRLSLHEMRKVISSTSRLVREQEGQSSKSCLTHDIVYDKRDSTVHPIMGWAMRLTNEIAGLGGTTKYLRNSFKAEYYYPFLSSWVLALEAHCGILTDFGKKTRILDRFVLGGSNLRGFETEGVTPRDRITLEPLGGHRFYTASAELNFPVSQYKIPRVEGSLFIDSGNIWLSKERGPEVSESKRLRLSVGCGLRLGSIPSPISFDLAIALSKDEMDKTQDISFGFKTVL